MNKPEKPRFPKRPEPPKDGTQAMHDFYGRLTGKKPKPVKGGGNG